MEIVFFLLNAAFSMVILDLTSRVHLTPFVIMIPKYFKYSTFSTGFWSIIMWTGDGWLEILITSVAFHIHFHYIASLFSISLSIMPCSAVSSLVNNTRSSACFAVQILSHPPPLFRSCLLGTKTSILTLRLLMSYIYGVPILDVSRSHTTTQHSR